MLEAIGTELKVIRVRKGLKLKDVANDLGINNKTLGRYETNAVGLSVERLEEILNYYSIDKNIFFKNICDNMHKQ